MQVTPLAQGLDEVEALISKYHSACEKYRRRNKIMVLQHAYVGRNEAELDHAARILHRFYCYFGAWFKNERPISQGLMQPLSAAEIEQHPFYKPADIRKNLMIGTPKEIIERLKHYEALGYDEFSYWADSGLSRTQKEVSLRRFIDEVMPAFN